MEIRPPTQEPEPQPNNFKKVAQLVNELVRQPPVEPLFGDEAAGEVVGVVKTLNPEHAVKVAIYDAKHADRLAAAISEETEVPLRVVGHIQSSTNILDKEDNTTMLYLLEDGSIFGRIEQSGRHIVPGGPSSDPAAKEVLLSYLTNDEAGAVYEFLTGYITD